jgi:hypothetical protein
MNKKTKMIKEDNQMMYNKWVSGIAKKEAPPEVITVDDIQNRYRNNFNYRAPSQLPFPLNNFLDFLGNLFVKSADMRRTLGHAVHYPIIKEGENKIEAIKKLNEKLNRIQDIIYSCTEELNILVENNKD